MSMDILTRSIVRLAATGGLSLCLAALSGVDVNRWICLPANATTPTLHGSNASKLPQPDKSRILDLAQTPPPPPPQNLPEPELTVDVMGKRRLNLPKSAPNYTIDRQQIDRQGAKNVADALKNLPGFAILLLEI